MAILSKACNQIILNCTTLTNIRGLRSNFVDCKSFFESNSPDILALYETNLDDSIDSGNFSVRGYLLLIRKGSSTHIYGLAVYVKAGLPFAWNWENYANSYLFLTCFNSLSVLFLFPLSITLSLCTVFDSISSNIDKVLWINPSAVFVFGDFNVHHKDWLTYSAGTDRLVNSVIICLSQMTLLRWLSFLLGSQTVIIIVLLFWISFFWHSCQKAPNPLFYEDHPILPTPAFSNFVLPVPPFLLPPTTTPTAHSVFFSLDEWVIMPHLMCCFTK